MAKRNAIHGSRPPSSSPPSSPKEGPDIPPSSAGTDKWAEERRVTRRRFLQLAGLAGFGLALNPRDLFAPFRQIVPLQVGNPLAYYPNRDWERVYRNLFETDRSFVFLCAPNDTHNCLLRAWVKNDVVVRIEPTYGYHKATDLAGNSASTRWDPRCCQKGLVLMRRLYGDRRVKGAFVRRGFKAWVDEGFPRDPRTGMPPERYLNRGWDSWVQVSFAEAFSYHARALENIARTYSGEQGRRFLEAQGYDPDMIEAMEGAGTRTLKFRGGMALLGAVRLFGTFRMANCMALLDHYIRGVGPDGAKGGGHGTLILSTPISPPAIPWCRASKPMTSSFTTRRTRASSSPGG